MPVSGCPFSRAGITDPGYSSSVPDFYLDKPPRLRGHFSPMKTTSRLLTTLLLFLSVSLAAPNAYAVVPPPDGGYPGGNTAEGRNALFSLTTGGFNTGVGYLSLRSDTTGSFNTAIGAGTLLANTADANTATGTVALLSNTTGTDNTANGAFALFSNIDGGGNTATGGSGLFSNTTGSSNTANGYKALFGNTAGSQNTATGALTLFDNTTGSQNTATGDGALFSTTGDFNTASGFNALVNNTTGGSNTALGDSAGFNVTTASHVICIGANVQGENISNTCYIGNIFGVTSAGGAGVFVNANGKLGTATSSRRFKEEIRLMESASEALFALKPVTFRYKKEMDPQAIPQFGLVAEDVEAVNPDLVVRDKEGKVNTVRYEAVNAMLLNEFLKEHRKMEQLERTVADLAAQLQKVTAQMEMNKPAAQVALNRQ